MYWKRDEEYSINDRVHVSRSELLDIGYTDDEITKNFLGRKEYTFWPKGRLELLIDLKEKGIAFSEYAEKHKTAVTGRRNITITEDEFQGLVELIDVEFNPRVIRESSARQYAEWSNDAKIILRSFYSENPNMVAYIIDNYVAYDSSIVNGSEKSEFVREYCRAILDEVLNVYNI